MTFKELTEKLKAFNMTVNEACVDIRNREYGVIKGWVVKNNAERKGGELSATESALFSAYLHVLTLERQTNG